MPILLNHFPRTLANEVNVFSSEHHGAYCRFTGIPKKSCPDICYGSAEYGKEIAQWMCDSRESSCAVEKCEGAGYKCTSKKQYKNTVSVFLVSAERKDTENTDIVLNGLSVGDSAVPGSEKGIKEGMNIAVLANGSNTFSRFMVTDSKLNNGPLQNMLHSISFGSVVMIVLHGDESNHVTRYTKFLLESFG